METLNRINLEIFELKRQQEYTRALDIYKTRVHGHFHLEEIREFDLLVANILNCLRKTSQFEAAYRFVLQTLSIKPSWHTHPQTSFEFGWSVYHLLKTTPSEKFIGNVPENVIITVEFFRNIEPSKEYMLFSLLFLELSRKLMQKGPAVALLSGLMHSLDENHFNGPEDIVKQKETGEKDKRASDKETFLVRKAKAMLLNSEFDECIETCNKAFTVINRFHHGNHIWLARNLAMALQNKGNTGLAIEKMEEILIRKKDWFLYHQLAEMYKQKGENDKCLLNLCKAALQQGHSEYKAGLYEQMGTTYRDLFDDILVCKTLWLAMKTRNEKQWKIPEALTGHIFNHKCTEPEMNTIKLYRELSLNWNRMLEKYNEPNLKAPEGGLLADGTITRLLNEGENGDGFITTSDGVSIYFRVKKVKAPVEKIITGTRIKVFAQSRQYKGKTVYNAIWVKIENP